MGSATERLDERLMGPLPAWWWPGLPMASAEPGETAMRRWRMRGVGGDMLMRGVGVGGAAQLFTKGKQECEAKVMRSPSPQLSCCSRLWVGGGTLAERPRREGGTCTVESGSQVKDQSFRRSAGILARLPIEIVCLP